MAKNTNKQHWEIFKNIHNINDDNEKQTTNKKPTQC